MKNPVKKMSSETTLFESGIDKSIIKIQSSFKLPELVDEHSSNMIHNVLNGNFSFPIGFKNKYPIIKHFLGEGGFGFVVTAQSLNRKLVYIN